MEAFARGVMSGRDRSIRASVLRGMLRPAEPVYATAMRLRNAAYDSGILKTHRLPRPTVSIGNITTGGTGKTPMVRWLAEQVIARGMRPAVLLRGYRSRHGMSDEQKMLEGYLPDIAIV